MKRKQSFLATVGFVLDATCFVLAAVIGGFVGVLGILFAMVLGLTLRLLTILALPATLVLIVVVIFAIAGDLSLAELIAFGQEFIAHE